MKKAASRALAFPKAQVGRFGPDGLGRRKAEVQGFQDGRDKPVEFDESLTSYLAVQWGAQACSLGF